MKKFFAVTFVAALVCATLAGRGFSQEMIPKIGDRCPNNYISEGIYCMPMSGAKEAIPKVGARCPHGFSVDGDYCYRPQKGTSKIIPKTDRRCPKGFSADGDYCVSFKK